MTKGQRAMAVAMMYPEAGGKKGRGTKDEGKKVAETATFGLTLLRQARVVLQWAPELAPGSWPVPKRWGRPFPWGGPAYSGISRAGLPQLGG